CSSDVQMDTGGPMTRSDLWSTGCMWLNSGIGPDFFPNDNCTSDLRWILVEALSSRLFSGYSAFRYLAGSMAVLTRKLDSSTSQIRLGLADDKSCP
ncbi:hypothetical protein AVEN_182490-2-1, partial [Araneus ventricosus]